MASFSNRTKIWVWVISGILALLSVLPVMNVCSDQGPCGAFLVLGLVGIFFSGIVSYVHDPNALLAALLNWVIFATVAIVLLKLWARRKGAPRR